MVWPERGLSGTEVGFDSVTTLHALFSPCTAARTPAEPKRESLAPSGVPSFAAPWLVSLQPTQGFHFSDERLYRDVRTVDGCLSLRPLHLRTRDVHVA